MKFGISNVINQSDCLVLGVFADKQCDALSAEANAEIKPLLGRLKKTGDSLIHYQPQHIDANTLVLVNCGDKENYSQHTFLKVLKNAAKQLLNTHAESALVAIEHNSSLSGNWHLHHATLEFSHASYQFLNYKQKKKQHKLCNIHFYGQDLSTEALNKAQCLANGINLTRDLGNLPANDCTPSYLAQTATNLANEYDNFTTTVLGKDQMAEMGMGALLAVAQGSAEEPKLIEMNYHGGGDEAPIILVGKGITFDTGGITLKPGNGMDEMKFDMCGAASVFGTVKTIAAMKFPINVIGLVASAENMPSGTAVKPGDIVTSLSGQTIEIINTDAEGRLVLCDALSYAERHKPKCVIDIATLTGAIIVALGTHYTGIFSTDDELVDKILTASHDSCDKAWRMPLDKCYQDALDSPYADMVNATFNRAAGSITAACFLSHFTKKYRWAHLDIAGTATGTGNNKGATGRPVNLLTQFILNEAGLN